MEGADIDLLCSRVVQVRARWCARKCLAKEFAGCASYPDVQVAFEERSSGRVAWLRTPDRYGMLGYPGVNVNPCFHG